MIWRNGWLRVRRRRPSRQPSRGAAARPAAQGCQGALGAEGPSALQGIPSRIQYCAVTAVTAVCAADGPEVQLIIVQCRRRAMPLAAMSRLARSSLVESRRG